MRAHSLPFHPNRVAVGLKPNSQQQPFSSRERYEAEKTRAEMRERARLEALQAEEDKKAARRDNHLVVAMRKAKYIKNCRRRGVRPKRISKISLALIKEHHIPTKPRWPKRAKSA